MTAPVGKKVNVAKDGFNSEADTLNNESSDPAHTNLLSTFYKIKQASASYGKSKKTVRKAQS